MNKLRVIPLVFGITVIYCLLSIACSEQNDPETNKRLSSPSKLADPAVIKCINDGFIVESVKKNGVTILYLCKNIKNGKNCEAWEYFRKECSLE